MYEVFYFDLHNKRLGDKKTNNNLTTKFYTYINHFQKLMILLYREFHSIQASPQIIILKNRFIY